MNAVAYLRELLPRLAACKLAYHGLMKPPGPITLTFSVTNRCQSRCRTCQIWQLYRDKPDLSQTELTLSEIERIFRSLGHVYFFNISGGEPFLRPDLPDIVGLAIKYLSPGVVHIPTNALAPKLVERATAAILETMGAYRSDVPLTIKPSLDGVGEKHDAIRGVKGNFEKVMETVDRLKKIGERYPNLHVELGTVISTANIDYIEEIMDFVHTLGVESYRHEIAEQRAEFFNVGDPITPSAEQYQKVLTRFADEIRRHIGAKRRLTRVTEALRLVYYDHAGRILAEGRQVLPCLAGITNVHINPYGQVWPCCVLGYDKPLGELRQADCDFWRVWHSGQAKDVRDYIKAGNCACPLANQAYSNILCDVRATAKVVRNVIRFWHR